MLTIFSMSHGLKASTLYGCEKAETFKFLVQKVALKISLLTNNYTDSFTSNDLSVTQKVNPLSKVKRFLNPTYPGLFRSF